MREARVASETPSNVASARFPMRRDPAHLLRAFTVGSLFGMVAILALVVVGVYRTYYHHLAAHTEANIVTLVDALFHEGQGALALARTDGPSLSFRPDAASALDGRLPPYLRPLDVVKIKVFARDGTVVYSTDPSLVGKVDASNRNLARALAGETVSALKTTRQAADLPGERAPERDVIETYVPVRAGTGVVGAFEAYTDVSWSRSEVRDVLKVSAVIVLAVLIAVFGGLYLLMRSLTRQLSAAEAELEQMAITDSLTGLANRRYLMARAEEECARIARQRGRADKTGIGFIMADIDDFKTINDSHGHLVGDRVLKEIATRLRRVTRRYDIVGRYGGEEFLVVLPEADETETRSVAERVWQTMREAPFEVENAAHRITISVGCTCAAPGEDLTTAIKRADDALYQAKGEGRDRVAVV
jgi:diguanylate cyclase (GGDEF)-like protein